MLDFEKRISWKGRRRVRKITLKPVSFCNVYADTQKFAGVLYSCCGSTEQFGNFICSSLRHFLHDFRVKRYVTLCKYCSVTKLFLATSHRTHKSKHCSNISLIHRVVYLLYKSSTHTADLQPSGLSNCMLATISEGTLSHVLATKRLDDPCRSDRRRRRTQLCIMLRRK